MHISTAAKSRCHRVHNMLFRIIRDSVPNADIDVGDGSWIVFDGYTCSEQCRRREMKRGGWGEEK